MPAGYGHSTFCERRDIAALRKKGLSLSDIARRLGRGKVTLDREVWQKSGGRGYSPKWAQRNGDWRHRATSSAQHEQRSEPIPL